MKRPSSGSGLGELAWASALVLGLAFVAWLIFAAIVTVFLG